MSTLCLVKGFVHDERSEAPMCQLCSWMLLSCVWLLTRAPVGLALMRERDVLVVDGVEQRGRHRLQVGHHLRWVRHLRLQQLRHWNHATSEAHLLIQHIRKWWSICQGHSIIVDFINHRQDSSFTTHIQCTYNCMSLVSWTHLAFGWWRHHWSASDPVSGCLSASVCLRCSTTNATGES